MKKIMSLFAFLLLLTAGMKAQELDQFFSKADVFFNKYVASGKVAYSTIAADPMLLNELSEMISSAKVSENDSEVFQAFYINAYNLITIKGIIDHYPVNSPLKVSGFFDKIKYHVAGQSITLNDIENSILRPKYKDPRFHFVLVCGAVSCPPLINKAYLPATLASQMNEQTTLALNGNYFIQVDNEKKRVEGSEILKWYKEDFVLNGDEIDFINQYRKEKIPGDYKLTYTTYDWSLNGQ